MSSNLFLAHLVCSFLGTVGFCVIFNVKEKHYLWCGICGMSGWAAYIISSEITTPAVGTFLGAVVVAFMSRALAYSYKTALTIFLITGIFPLIPGGVVYHTMYYFITRQFDLALQYADLAIRCGFAIVAACVVISVIPSGFFKSSLK